MVIQRYLSDAHFNQMESDFKFLIKFFAEYDGELDIALRGTYFNIYYRGSSLAKVKFLSDGSYDIDINASFYKDSIASKDRRFTNLVKSNVKDRISLTLPQKHLHSFFQKAYLNDFSSIIKKRGYGEEIMREQAIITDNREREDFIIIDRQIQDTQWKERMDLLALEQIEGAAYQFRILEVKLGNNKELAEAVAQQLQNYVEHVTEHFNDYKACYEEVYRQRKALGLHDKPSFKNISIHRPVQGSVVVLGYSGLATKALANLRNKYPDTHVCEFHYRMDLTKCA